MLKKLQQALIDNSYSISIHEHELSNFQSRESDLPASFLVTFKITDFSSNTIFLENVGNASATKLLARFSYADNQIRDLFSEIASKEQINNPDIIFAEIIHFPEERIGNVLLHPSFYGYEVPYLTQSSLSKEKQIRLSDLYIFIEGSDIRLISKKLNKEIIPRLSNAHYYAASELPVYQFLCDMQNINGTSKLTFNWGEIAQKFVFLPRVTYKKIILHLATWNLSRDTWKLLIGLDAEELFNKLNEFRKKWRLPRYIVLVDYDNELFIDFEDTLAVQAFLHTIKSRESIILKEFLFDPDTPIRDMYDRKYANQFIASFVRKEPISNTSKVGFEDVNQSKTLVRTFAPGSEWVYYKFYCGTKTADTILIEVIKPLVQKLLKSKLIDSWFFIRYKDPNHHLRIRFHLKHNRNFSEVIDSVNDAFRKSIKQGLVRKVQLDTYEREIERYGMNSMHESEQLFFHDSEAIIDFLNTTSKSTEADEEIRWLWGMKAIDELLNDFKFSLDEKILLLEKLKTSFAAEFDLEKTSKLQLDKKYRNYKLRIESVLNNESNNLYHLEIITGRSKRLSIVTKKLLKLQRANKLTVEIRELLHSYIHMHINRLIPGSQRLHEMIIYDFMFRYYSSQKARLLK